MATVAEKMTAIADAIRAKTGGTEALTLDGMAEAIEGIASAGIIWNRINDRGYVVEATLTSLMNGDTLPHYCFNGQASTIGGSYYISGFYSQLEKINLPIEACTKIGEGALRTTYITEYIFPNVEFIGSYAMQSCPKLQEIDLPKLVRGENYCFAYNNLLETVNTPLLTTVGTGVFQRCPKLKNVDVKSILNISNNCFDMSSASYANNTLSTLRFSAAASIGTYAFRYCAALTALIIEKSDAICTLANINAFDNTPIASGTGYIYVPSALVNTYKANSVWSTFANQFRALEDYTVDGTITGELDASKI